MTLLKKDFLFQEINKLKGVGPKLTKYLRNKKIEKIKDILWDLPYDITDRSKITDLKKLEIGKIATIKVLIDKYSFPRIKNLPNRVICSNNEDKINIVFFNSREGYIRKILPIGQEVVISGKVQYYKKKYQITNPTYVKSIEKKEEIKKIFPKYSLTKGLTEKIYRKLVKDILVKIDDSDDWLDTNFLKENNFKKLKQTLINLHNPEKKIDIISNDYKRSTFLHLNITEQCYPIH